MKYLLLLFVLIFLLHCSKQKQENKTDIIEIAKEPVKRQTKQPEISNIETHQKDSSFDSFLTKFSSKKEFQLNRINFPFKVRLLDIEGNEENITISKGEWQHINLLDTAGIEVREFDAYSQTTEIGTNVTIIRLRGIDNGISIDFTFERRNGRWYLTKKFDSSS